MIKKDQVQKVEYPLPSDWRGKVMSKVRTLIKSSHPEVIEDVKWKTKSNPDGVLVWYCEGMICTGEIYKKHLRLTFAKGQSLKEQDTEGIINAYRAVIIHEEDKINEPVFKNLIRAAIALNAKGKAESSKK